MIDTNLWVRTLLGGPQTLFLLDAWRLQSFLPVISNELLGELIDACNRPRIRRRINEDTLETLLDELRLSADIINPTTIPPYCRDIYDAPVLAAAIDGKADAIVTGDADLRADEALRAAMLVYGVKLRGIETLRSALEYQ